MTTRAISRIVNLAPLADINAGGREQKHTPAAVNDRTENQNRDRRKTTAGTNRTTR
jgi:hypothetical protein